jgi:hypothetical protein
MARKVFYSFYYKEDASRAGQVRNMGILDGNQPAKDNDWEEVKKGGDAAIERWIKGQLEGKTCAVVLIGTNTAGRKWIDYEIKEAWNSGKGVVGIYIHGLKNLQEERSTKGSNPFTEFTMPNGWQKLSAVVKAHDPGGATSKDTYANIKDNLAAWIEEAIRIRANYKG